MNAVPFENGRLRWLGVLLLLLFVFGHAHSTAHHALVPHAECGSGGELVHVHRGVGSGVCAAGEGAGRVHDVVGEALAEAATPDDAPTFRSTDDHAHLDRCSFLVVVAARRGLFRSADVSSMPVVGSTVDASPRSQTFGAAVPVFRTAPKQSPPAVA